MESLEESPAELQAHLQIDLSKVGLAKDGFLKCWRRLVRAIRSSSPKKKSLKLKMKLLKVNIWTLLLLTLQIAKVLLTQKRKKSQKCIYNLDSKTEKPVNLRALSKVTNFSGLKMTLNNFYLFSQKIWDFRIC